ncbi:phage holin, partial [Streptococcus pseudopneumoniae]
MTQFNELIIAFATGFLAVVAGSMVKTVKDYLLRKGGEKAVIIAEILAKNAVHAVEQVAA